MNFLWQRCRCYLHKERKKKMTTKLLLWYNFSCAYALHYVTSMRKKWSTFVKAVDVIHINRKKTNYECSTFPKSSYWIQVHMSMAYELAEINHVPKSTAFRWWRQWRQQWKDKSLLCRFIGSIMSFNKRALVLALWIRQNNFIFLTNVTFTIHKLYTNCTFLLIKIRALKSLQKQTSLLDTTMIGC